jgi:NAD(P)H-hydrate epimerase
MFLSYDDYTSTDIMVLDENSEYLGVSRDKLMENAGASVARVAKKYVSNGSVAIIAGLGNNGGDGFVAARHLSRYTQVKVILLGSPERIRTDEARANYYVLRHLKDTVELIEEPSLDEVKSAVE